MEFKTGGSFISPSFRFTPIAQQRYKTERSGFPHSSDALKWFYPSSYIFVHLSHIFEISASWPMSQYTQSSARVLATLLCDQSKLPTRGQNHTVHCRWPSTPTFCRQRNKLQKLYFTQLIIQVQCFCYVWDVTTSKSESNLWSALRRWELLHNILNIHRQLMSKFNSHVWVGCWLLFRWEIVFRTHSGGESLDDRTTKIQLMPYRVSSNSDVDLNVYYTKSYHCVSTFPIQTYFLVVR